MQFTANGRHIATADGRMIPVAPGNADYDALIASGVAVAPYAPPAPTAASVKAEAQRRIIVRTGATDLSSCIVRQLNATMRGVELTNKIATGGTLTAGEAAEAAALQALADDIKAIRSASNSIEALSPIPANYAADHRWP